VTHGQIHAEFAARKLSPEEAADGVLEGRAVRGKARTTKNPIVLLCLLALACVASLFGIRTNQQS
jgi:hypothetical protein